MKHVRRTNFWQQSLKLKNEFSDAYNSLFSKFIFPNRLILILVFSFIFMFLRNTDLLLSPQLWGEDGKHFYADAYNHGLSPLLWTYAGFYQTFLRLAGLIANFIGLEYVPLFFSLLSLGSMLLPIFIIWSDENLLFGPGKRKQIFLLTLIYLLIPMHWETLGNLTNCGWYLAISAALVIARNKKSAVKWRWFDYSVLAISGLTGPYSLLFVLPALYMKLTDKNSRVVTIKLLIVIVCAAIQVLAIANNPIERQESSRSQVRTIVKEYKRPLQVTGMRFVVEPIMQSKYPQQELAYSDQVYLLGAVIVVLWIVALLKLSQHLKAIVFFCISSYVVMLFRVSGEYKLLDHWDTMQISNLGARYIMIPFFGWAIILIVFAQRKSGLLKHISVAMLCALFIMLPLSYHLKRTGYKHYGIHVEEFKRVPSGDTYCFPENPDGWEMCLTKK